MTYEFDNNTAETTTDTGASLDLGNINVPAKVSSVTAVTDKEAEKAAKKAVREAKKAAADVVKAAEKAAKATARAEAKAAKEAEKVAKAAEKAAEAEAAEAKATAIAAAVSSVLRQGDVLAKKFASAEASKVNFKNDSRQVTYDLLVDVMAYVEELNKRTDVSDVLDTMRWELRKKWNMKTQDNTSDLGVIVKYITRTKRKNAHMYARVLEEAFKHKANSGNLLIYIERCGGINKIVASSKAKTISNKKRLHNAYKRYAQTVLVHNHHAGGMGKISLSHDQINEQCDKRDDAHFVYTFGKIENGELVVIDFVPWVNRAREDEFFLHHTLSTITQPGNSSQLDEHLTAILHKKMAAMFDKYNAGRWKRNFPPINQFGEVASGVQPTNFSVFDWAQFDAEYAEYLAAKELQQLQS